MHAKSFRDLDVYQAARSLSDQIFKLSQPFPKEETYALTDQIRRSSRSVGAQIAEAWGKRRYEAHFVSKLTDADAEQMETQHWLETATDCAYLTAADRDLLLGRCGSIGRMLQAMIDKAPQFCHGR
jgi:four helix bundle protein